MYLSPMHFCQPYHLRMWLVCHRPCHTSLLHHAPSPYFFFLPSTISCASLLSSTCFLSFPPGRQQIMTDILDAQVDELLRKAEQRLRDGPAASADLVPAAARGVKPDTVKVVQQPASDSSSSKKNDLSVRAPPQPQTGLKSKEKVRILSLLPSALALHDESKSQIFS